MSPIAKHSQNMLKYRIMSELKIANDKLNSIRFSADTLKIIAIIAMLIDHFSYGVLHAYLLNNAMSILPQTYTKLNNLYNYGRNIGRLSMPIFAFFLVEGFLRTSNLKRYILRMLIFALASEIPFDLGLYNSYWYIEHQNILFTFVIGLIMLSTIRYLNRTILGLSDAVKAFAIICCVIAYADLSYILKCDYNVKCIIVIAILYFLRECKPIKLLAGAAALSWEKFAPISFLLLYFYDPDKSRKLKYFFYVFYPAHFILIFIVSKMVMA